MLCIKKRISILDATSTSSYRGNQSLVKSCTSRMQASDEAKQTLPNVTISGTDVLHAL